MLDARLHQHLHKRSLRVVRTPEDRAALLHAAEVIGLCDAAPDEVSEERLKELLDAILPLLSAKGATARSYGAGWLWQLAAKHDAAAACLREAMRSRNARTRLIAVQFLGFVPASGPLKTAMEKEVLRTGLRDKSRVVRSFSADRIGGRIYLDLLPDLENALKVERNPKARRAMEHSRDGLVHGYTVLSTSDPMREEVVSCYFQLKGASCGVSIPKALVDKVGLAELVRRARARQYDRKIPGDRFDPLPPGYENAGVWPDSVLEGPHFMELISRG